MQLRSYLRVWFYYRNVPTTWLLFYTLTTFFFRITLSNQIHASRRLRCVYVTIILSRMRSSRLKLDLNFLDHQKTGIQLNVEDT